MEAPNFRFDRMYISPSDWEHLLLSGWDRVGSGFFSQRFDHFRIGDELRQRELMPLRYDLRGFRFTASQRKILRRNADLEIAHGPADFSDEKTALFDRWHRGRFGFDSSLFHWVSPVGQPIFSHEITIRLGGRLVAASFFDRTLNCQYSTAAMFDPDESRRSLGTLTLLAEIWLGIETGKRFHFPGHAYRERSIYDYKKAFRNMERFDWDSKMWLPLSRFESRPDAHNSLIINELNAVTLPF